MDSSSKTKKRIYLSSPTMHGLEEEYVHEAFESNWIAPLGPHVDLFEEEVCVYAGGKYAAALSSGTAAIHLALKLLGVGKGDIVFCPSLTFAASAFPVTYEGATPVFIDSETDTWNMDPEALELAYRKYGNPKALVIVHLYGTPAKFDELKAIAAAHGTPIIEDAAESMSALYKGNHTGTLGDFGIYSFNGNKIITTSGGGMLLSSDEAAIKRARFLATQARDPARWYEHSTIGYNYRMSNITAAIGRGQLRSIEFHRAMKRDIYNTYRENLTNLPGVAMNPINPDCEANYWLSCITIDRDSKITPDMLIDALEAENIEARPIWKPMHLQPVFADCDFFTTKEEGSNAQSIFDTGICLPSDIKNTKDDMELVINTIRRVFLRHLG